MNLLEELCDLKEVTYLLSNSDVDELPMPGVGETCLLGCPDLGILVVYLMEGDQFEYGFAPIDKLPEIRADLIHSPFAPYLRKVEAKEWFERVDFARFEDYSTFKDPKVVESIIGFFLESVEAAMGAQKPAV